MAIDGQASRRQILSDPIHRIHFVFTPKHSSWLNQIEVVFGIINRLVMRRGKFTSRAVREDQLKRLLKYYDDTMAHPFRWTDTGQPTTSPQNSLAVQSQNRHTDALVMRKFGCGGLAVPVKAGAEPSRQYRRQGQCSEVGRSGV